MYQMGVIHALFLMRITFKTLEIHKNLGSKMARTGRWQILGRLTFYQYEFIVYQHWNQFFQWASSLDIQNKEKWSSDFTAQTEAQSLLTRTVNNKGRKWPDCVGPLYSDWFSHLSRSFPPKSINQKRGKHNTQIISLPQNYVFCFICESEYQVLRRSADSGPLHLSLFFNQFSRVWKSLYSCWFKFIFVLLLFLPLQIKCQ